MDRSPQKTIIYISREIERALGIAPSESYRIIANRTPYGEKIKRQYPDFVTLVEGPTGDPLGTGDLLAHEETRRIFEDIAAHVGSSITKPPAPLHPTPSFLVFKNTPRIEAVANEHSWKLINPSAALAEKIENKISQIAWLGELSSYLPPHRIEVNKAIIWKGVPFIVQWAHGHTGGGTILVDSESVLKDLQAKFPERRARVTDYVPGPSFTVNVVVTPETVAGGSISYQITGLAPFTDMPFATVGNDWGVVGSILSTAELETIRDIISKLGAKMQKESWRGLFGIDLIRDAKTGRLCLIELNARQPASATFESALEDKRRTEEGMIGMTIFEAHIAALLGRPLQPIIPIESGAQIVQRVTGAVHSIPEDATGSLELAGYEVVSYPNTAPGSDLLRIQSAESLMAGHEAFNERGKEIVEVVSDTE